MKCMKMYLFFLPYIVLHRRHTGQYIKTPGELLRHKFSQWPVFPHPALLLLLLGLLLLEAAHARVAGGAGKTGEAFWGVLAVDLQLWIPKRKQKSWTRRQKYMTVKILLYIIKRSLYLWVWHLDYWGPPEWFPGLQYFWPSECQWCPSIQ